MSEKSTLMSVKSTLKLEKQKEKNHKVAPGSFRMKQCRKVRLNVFILAMSIC